MAQADLQRTISPTEEIINEARNGRMFILVDDEDRENEGDFIFPAQMVTPDAINFMAKHGRGLICLAVTRDRADQLGLAPMSRDNRSQHETAFTQSIEARQGVTTGISASDRARTIAVAVDASRGRDDIVSPGHVFPLVARDGGVLVRAGHTEAAVDIARLAGLVPAGVICEIMNEDGTMARLHDLVPIARRHGVKIGTIRDLIAYRRRHDHLVERVGETPFHSDYGGEWRLQIFRNQIDGSESFVLLKGQVSSDAPTLVRVHTASIFSDLLGQPGPRRHSMQRAMTQIAEAGSGLIVLLPIPSREFHRVNSPGDLDPEFDLRSNGIGAQILADMGVREMVLISSSPNRAIIGLEGYGLTVVGQLSLDPD
ncbi:MAG TPA: 3,4-dihydroxy-2-butanone-4-phosphate synthase [Allosphingosinicella sp.]|nr:3,4-dihydroxy-2-butanone-4-phosphate synthase [Allosphingosinicella sp.]